MGYDAENTLILEVNGEKIFVELLPDVAPRHVERIKLLAGEGFYDGCPFHRVIDGFMAQTGDGKYQDGTGGSDYPDLKAEFNDTKHERGTVSMARAAPVDSANSQFFICFASHPHLDGQYTVFGKVVEGMEVVDSIRKANPGSDMVASPDVISKAFLLADA